MRLTPGCAALHGVALAQLPQLQRWMWRASGRMHERADGSGGICPPRLRLQLLCHLKTASMAHDRTMTRTWYVLGRLAGGDGGACGQLGFLPFMARAQMDGRPESVGESGKCAEGVAT